MVKVGSLPDFECKPALTFENELSEEINCPNSNNDYCNSLSCKDNCNFKGYCLNGKCHCLPGYAGEHCQNDCIYVVQDNNCMF